MNLELIAMFVPVAIVVIVMKFYLSETISWFEVAAQFLVAGAIVFGTYQVGLKSRMHDRQFLNGVVTKKEKDTVSCEHDYKCNCSTDSSGKESCSTCYEHFNDYDWNVETNAGKGKDSKFKIERIDRQGSETPPRWAAVQIGEPVALERDFDNYILAAPDSIFHVVDPSKARKLPAYPKGYDYSYVDRVVADGVAVPDQKLWNADLTRMLSVIGPQKQANVVVVFTADPSAQYATDLRTRWLGGKKNDVVVVLGTPHYPDIAWVNVFSWSKRDMLNVSLRNDLSDLKTVERDKIISTIRDNVAANFERRPMAEYEYLRGEIEPTPTFRIIGWLLAILAPLGLGIYFHLREDGSFAIGSGSRRFSSFNSRQFRSRRF